MQDGQAGADRSCGIDPGDPDIERGRILLPGVQHQQPAYVGKYREEDDARSNAQKLGRHAQGAGHERDQDLNENVLPAPRCDAGTDEYDPDKEVAREFFGP